MGKDQSDDNNFTCNEIAPSRVPIKQNFILFLVGNVFRFLFYFLFEVQKLFVSSFDFIAFLFDAICRCDCVTFQFSIFSRLVKGPAHLFFIAKYASKSRISERFVEKGWKRIKVKALCRNKNWSYIFSLSNIN